MNFADKIEIREITYRSRYRDWLKVPYLVFERDANWVPPFRIAERQRISPSGNPFFSFGDAVFYVAYRNGVPVGRISAHVNSVSLAQGDTSGNFGFFDCIDDDRVAAKLLEAAEQWLRKRDVKTVVGPYSLTMLEEAGLLVHGFDTPPTILSGHAPIWAGPFLESAGYKKAIDLFAYRMRMNQLPIKIARLSQLAKQMARIQVRRFDMSEYQKEVALIFDIFNDAWSENWGFIPVQEAEVKHLAKETKPIMRPEFGLIVEIDGEPAAMGVALPNINTIIKSYGGRLLPLNWAKLAFALWRNRWKTGRIPLLGVRKRYRATPIAAAVLSLLVAEFIELGRHYQLEWVEFSWVLENNAPMVALAQLAAGPPTKIYRVYEKEL